MGRREGCTWQPVRLQQVVRTVRFCTAQAERKCIQKRDSIGNRYPTAEKVKMNHLSGSLGMLSDYSAHFCTIHSYMPTGHLNFHVLYDIDAVIIRAAIEVHTEV